MQGSSLLCLDLGSRVVGSSLCIKILSLYFVFPITRNRESGIDTLHRTIVIRRWTLVRWRDSLTSVGLGNLSSH